MAGLKRQTLDNWIADALIDGDKDGAIVMLSLVHHAGSKQVEVHSVPFKTTKKWTARELAQLFQSKADGYAQDLSGAQMFSLLAFYGESAEPQARHPFQVIGEPDISANMTSEPPTKEGVTSQSMRHLEFAHREMYGMMKHLVDSLTQTNSTQAARLREQEQELHESYKVLRELMLGRLTEDHQQKLAEMKAERENALWDKALEYGPLLLDAITGGKLLPTSKKDSILIDTIVSKLPGDKLREIVGMLPPEAAAPLASRLAEAHQAAQLAAQSAEKALSSAPSEDAGGE